MLEFFKNIQEKIDARIMRERALIFFSALAIIFMVWNFVVQAPIDEKIEATKLQLDGLASQRAAMEAQITVITQSLLNDPDKQKKTQISQLENDISQLDTQLQSASQNLIKADQLPQALQEVLQKTQQLTVLEVKTLPARELQFLPIDGETKATDEDNNAGVYQHLVELHVSGSYPQLLQLLISLEQLPWRFYWQSLEYSVAHYPNAEIILRVYTLSSEEGLLGV